jgi:hypothetical protein
VLEAEEYLPPGTSLSLLLIRAKRGSVECQGEVVWAEDPPPRPTLRHGIRITRMDPEQQQTWECFLREAARELGRRPLRYDVEIPVTCCRRGNGEKWAGHALNVSRRGLLVLLPTRVPEETIISLHVQTPTQSLTADARVVRVERARPDGLFPHGVAFIDAETGSCLLPALFLLGLL